jgi:nucleotide-binding universal stress UspA family protein
MTFLVPFDGSELAEAALVRAVEFGTVLEEDVLAVTVIPNGNATYARDHEWIGPDEPFELDQIVSKVHNQVVSIAPSANYRHKTVDRYASAGTISTRVRRMARDENATMVFIGSENAGHMVIGVASVGGRVAADESYDVVIVRDRSPARIAKIKNRSPYRKPKSDFYLPE